MATYTGRVDNPESMGRMLQQGRLLRGLSQRQLADELGISQRYVWEIEAGKPSIFTERLFRMMRATGVTFFAEIDDHADEVGSHG